jgi:S-adenosylmethionine:tRNA ribosyltransferase-isomerase
MKTQDLDYYLPPDLIAQQPADVRSESRLLVLQRDSGRITDSTFNEIRDFLRAGDCLVLNDTKVLPARFFARRTTGGKLEGLFLSESSAGLWEVMLKGAGKVEAGEQIVFKNKTGGDFCDAQVQGKKGEGIFKLKISCNEDYETILEEIGFPPLPPYIKRDTDFEQAKIDKERYQTVYANSAGAVAAPTAGLHFTKELIEQLKDKGVKFAYVTLHVGVGTFKPVTTEMLEEHKMHSEWFSINEDTANLINEAKKNGGRIIAVGTTSVRTLESAAEQGKVKAMSGSTEIFIKPGYEFKIVDAMVTNFHLPKSTLLALVGAFAGLDKIFAAYNHAIEQRYRFYSYGDAMMIT